MFGISSALLPIAAAFIFGVVLTPIVRRIARRFGAVAQPKPDRWHRKPTAMFGGVAIYLSVALTYWLFMPHNRGSLIVLTCSTLLFLIGTIDDIFHIKPHQKLIGQIIGASIPVYFGLTLPWTGSQVVNIALTIFWLIGITNSLNLLDNMDGLAAGIAAIASICLGVNFVLNGQIAEAGMLAVLAAALIAFLIYNSTPASIFMGDSGSMFIGFFLAATALLSSAGAMGRSRSLLSVLAAPVLIFVIPIFDTTLVTLLRRASGRAISQGGRDHTSHRLVALGLSERRAVMMLYAFAASSGGLALLVREQQIDVSIAAIAGFSIILTLIGVYLAGVKVYDPADARPSTALSSFLIDLSYKRRIFEVVLDVVLILLAYYLSYALLFGPMAQTPDWYLFLRSAPLVVIAKLSAFLALGVYRGLWRYTGLRDLLLYARAVIVGSMVAALTTLFVFRFEGFSRTAFVIDGLLLLMFVSMSRVAFRLFRTILPVRRAVADRRVLIYGAGDAGELLLRELNNNPDLAYIPVAYIDDDARKAGKVLHGLRIYDTANDLDRLLEQERVDEVLVSSMKVPRPKLQQLIQRCPESIPIKRMEITFVPIGQVLVDEKENNELYTITAEEL
jgi:UDP-GlcNAc:undecaprenyl-phosphate/decaprenyl-phosphate GlcNAc-1-phosphate transferase